MREAALEAAHEAATAHKGGAALASAAINSSAIGKSPVVDVSNYYSTCNAKSMPGKKEPPFEAVREAASEAADEAISVLKDGAALASAASDESIDGQLSIPPFEAVREAASEAVDEAASNSNSN